MINSTCNYDTYHLSRKKTLICVFNKILVFEAGINHCEIAHFQNLLYNLPSLTDFGDSKKEAEIIYFLSELVLAVTRKKLLNR